MTPPSYTVLFAIATRIAFTLTPLPAALTTRMELASPSTGIEPLCDAALLSTSGSASLGQFRGSRLLLPLYAITGGNLVVHVVLGAACDFATALLLKALLLHTGASPHRAAAAVEAFAWSPLTLLACISGALGPLHVVCVVGCAAAVWTGRAAVAGAALALGVEIGSAHTALFAVRVYPRPVPLGVRVQEFLLYNC
jgi:hypothetical protein